MPSRRKEDVVRVLIDVLRGVYDFLNDFLRCGTMTPRQFIEKEVRTSVPDVILAELPNWLFEAQVAVARVAVARKLTPEQTREVAREVEKAVKRLPGAPPRYIEEKADEVAREIKHEEDRGGGKEVEIETITCQECDADFRIFHVGPNRHRIVKVT